MSRYVGRNYLTVRQEELAEERLARDDRSKRNAGLIALGFSALAAAGLTYARANGIDLTHYGNDAVNLIGPAGTAIAASLPVYGIARSYPNE